jgi:hypothetical protein
VTEGNQATTQAAETTDTAKVSSSYSRATKPTTSPQTTEKVETYEERVRQGRQPKHVLLSRSTPGDMYKGKEYSEAAGRKARAEIYDDLMRKLTKNLHQAGYDTENNHLPIQVEWICADKKDVAQSIREKKLPGRYLRYMIKIQLVDKRALTAIEPLVSEYAYKGLSLKFRMEQRDQPPLEHTHTATVYSVFPG